MNMRAILSIKPHYVEKIIQRKKKVEFRKKIFKKDVNSIYVYSSYPIQKIPLEITNFKIKNDYVTSLWENYKKIGGISEKAFFQYFKDYKKGYAIEIKKFKVLPKPLDPFSLIENFRPPQNFSYFKNSIIENIDNIQQDLLRYY